MAKCIFQLGWVLSTLLAIGCRSNDPVRESGDTFSVRDSAGVLIAENSGPNWGHRKPWRVSAEPFLVIGSRDGGHPGTEFTGIIDATRLVTGRIIVADRGSQQIRVFDPSGQLLFSVGGRGEGPSEFVSLDRVGVISGDSIVAYDRALAKHVIFSPDGSLGRNVRDPAPDWAGLHNVRVAGWFGDGSFVVNDEPSSSQLTPGTTVVVRQWHRFDTDGNHIEEIARLPHERRTQDGSAITFGPSAEVHLTRTGFWYGISDACEFRHFGASGLEHIIRASCEREPISSSAKEELRQLGFEYAFASLKARVPPEQHARLRAQVERSFMGREYADSLPAYSSFLPAKDGYFWVEKEGSLEEYLDPQRAPGGGFASPEWIVFSPEGRWLGTVAFPRGLRVTEIGEDYVLGSYTDSLDVPYVAVHHIQKPLGD